MVEFALVVPFLLVLLLAVCDLGAATLAKSNLSYAGRQGARLLESYGASSVDPDSAIIAAITTTMQAGGLDVTQLQSITITRANPGDAPGPTRVYTFSGGTLTGAPTGNYTPTGVARQHGDVVGITIRYHYRGLTLLLAHGLDLTDATYTRIDPETIGVALPTPAPTPTVTSG